MPQIYDMGPTALLPLRRKACWGFFALKIRRLRPGLNPRTWVLKASMLPLDHRSHTTLVSYLLCWRRHVSAAVGHLQVQPTTRSRWKFRICTYTMIILCIVFLLYTFLWPEDGPQWPKHVVVSTINRIKNRCVLTYPTPSLDRIMLLSCSCVCIH